MTHKGKWQKIIKHAILWIVFTILLATGFAWANQVAQFSTVSLRYSSPISGQVAHRARQYSAHNPQGFWPTFWHQTTAAFSTTMGRNINATAINFSGNGGLVWPMEFITGATPSSIDGAGIAITRNLAHSLFGSVDVVGMTAYVDGYPRIVRGVFEGDTNLALVSFHIEDTSQSFTAVELSGGDPHPTRQNAESFAMLSGLGRPNYIIMGGPGALSRFMSIVPLAMPAIYLLWLAVAFIRKHYKIAAAPLLFGSIIAFAIALPILLNLLPPWAIPTRWGDFAFWATLATQGQEALREFLSISPMLRDIELHMLLLKQAGVAVLATVCGLLACAVDQSLNHS